MTPSKITTFRVPALAQTLKEKLAALHSLIFGMSDLDVHSEDSDDLDGGPSSPKYRKELGDHKGDTGGEGMDGGLALVEKTLSSAEIREQRRKERIARKNEMRELERSKPSENSDDPRDIEAINQAKATMGNYLLKTAPDYKVPESQRINAEKKKRQMCLLEESVHAIKIEFTKKVLALRSFKEEVKASVKKDLIMLRQIDADPADLQPYIEAISAPKTRAEYPETRFDFDEKDLEAFQNEKKEYADRPPERFEFGRQYDIRSTRLRKMQRRHQYLRPNDPISLACQKEFDVRTVYNRQQLE